MVTRLRYPKGYQFFDANGAPLALGNLYYYVAGTTTLQDTYSDAAGTVANTNPLVLDASGRLDADVYLGSSANYKEVLTTASATVSPWPDDNIPLASQPDWNATSGPNQILNKPVLAEVATSGSYTDLSNTPATQSSFVGDSGSGGSAGLVPAPAAGDAAANMFLSASGAWETLPGTSISVTLQTSAAAASATTLTFASVPGTVQSGMSVSDATNSEAISSGTIVASTTSTTVTLSSAVTGSGVASGDSIVFAGTSSVATNLSISETSAGVAIGSSTGSGITIPAATGTVAGVLDAARATKIDALATVASSGSYSDLSNKPNTFGAATSGAAGSVGLVPAPAAGQQDYFLRGDATWAASSGGGSATNLSVSETSTAVTISSSTGTGATIPAATSSAAGALDSTRAAKIDGLATVATSGSYTDLTDKPAIPSIPSALAGQNLDNVARLGVNTTDTGNALSVNAPSVLFYNNGDMRATLSKGAASNTAAFDFQDNFSTRTQFGLLGNDSFTIAMSPDGTAFNNALISNSSGAVTFPNSAGFTGATSSAAGSAGFVPSPAAGQQGSFLRGDGTWDQMTAAQVTGLAPSAATDTTNASNITSGTLPAAQLPVPSPSTLGGVEAATAPSNQFMTGISTSGVPQFAQPSASDISGLSGTYAPLASPVLTGTPAAPTASAGTNSTQIATTAYLDSKLGANNGIATLNASGTLTASQIPASLVGAVVYQGTWNASTNTPTLASGVGTKGNYYIVSTSGTTAIDGVSSWNAGDAIIFDGTKWDHINGASPEVLSVVGLTGAISGSALVSAMGLSASATTDTTNASNISAGTLPAARLPAPASSALGGVEAASASTGQFMTGINTSGVPQFATPAYGQISGTPTLGSLASLSSVNNGNWSGTALSIGNGGTGQASASAAFNALSPMSAAGDLIYGGASGAASRLALGTNNYLLAAGSSAPQWESLTSLLDTLGSAAQGDILYRGASSWSFLAPGSSGQYLQTQGAGANPQWGFGLSYLPTETYNIYHTGTGGNFANIIAALTYFNSNIPVNGATLQLDAGTHTYTTNIYVGRNWTKDVAIVGATPTTVSITSIQSTSGSSGNWSAVLNVSSTAGISTSDYLCIYGTSGGTNPELIEGCWAITNVNSGSYQITVSLTTSWGSGTVSTGSVTGTAVALHTILSFTGGTDGFDVWDGASGIGLQNVALVGNGTAGTTALSIQDQGRLLVGNSIIGVNNWGGSGIYTNLASHIVGGTLIVSNCGVGLSTDTESAIDLSGYLVCNGNSGRGIVSSAGSRISTNNSIDVCGNGSHGMWAESSAIIYPGGGPRCNANTGYGYYTQLGGVIDCRYVTSNNNTTGSKYLPIYYDDNNGTPLNIAFGGRTNTTAQVTINAQSSSTDALDIYQGDGTALVASVSYAGKITGSSFAPAAGTSSVAPLKLTSGTNLTTAAAGATEYDGKAFYDTPVNSVRCVRDIEQFSLVTSNISLSNSTSTQSYLASGAQNFAVQAGNYYFFEAEILLNTSNASGNFQTEFSISAGNSATISGLNWSGYTGYNATGTAGGCNSVRGSSSAAPLTVVQTAYCLNAVIRGSFYCSASGTIEPLINFSAANVGSTAVSIPGSYFRLWSVGGNTGIGGLS